jgi:hypothetical protein
LVSADTRRAPPRWRGLHVAVAFVALTGLSGCLEETLSLRLDLCPGRDATREDLQLLQNIVSWNIEVWAIENHDVSWRRIWAGSDTLDELIITGAVPRDQQVRLLVEGFGLDNDGSHRVIALGASGLLVLQGSENVCLCVAPPERYEELCEVWTCSFNVESGLCESPR